MLDSFFCVLTQDIAPLCPVDFETWTHHCRLTTRNPSPETKPTKRNLAFSITIWSFNIAMENHLFVIGTPSISMGHFMPFSMAMLNNQRVHHIDVYIETLYIQVWPLHGTTVLTHSSPSYISHLSPLIPWFFHSYPIKSPFFQWLNKLNSPKKMDGHDGYAMHDGWPLWMAKFSLNHSSTRVKCSFLSVHQTPIIMMLKSHLNGSSSIFVNESLENHQH